MPDSAPLSTRRRRRTAAPVAMSSTSPSSTIIYVVGTLLALLLSLAVSFEALWSVSVALTVAGTAILVLLLGLSPRLASNGWITFLRGGTPFALALLVWTTVRFFTAPDYGFAIPELLRVLSGVTVYLLIAYAMPLRNASFALGVGLVGIGLIVSLINLSLWGSQGGLSGGTPTTFFATHEATGSLLMLLLPLPLAFAVNPKVGDPMKLGGFAAALLLSVSLLLTRCRSSFAGTVMAAVVLIYLTTYYSAKTSQSDAGADPDTVQKRRSPASTKVSRSFERLLTSPMMLILLAVVTLSLIYGTTSAFYLRASSGQELGDSLGTRLKMWRGAVLMLQEKPLDGWGLGSYARLESCWTHLGRDPKFVPALGATHLNVAHNFYVQLAAETGVVGVALHVALFTALLAMAFTAIRRMKATPHEWALLIGITAALSASGIDAIASPSYNFSGISLLWWILLGMEAALLESFAVRRRRGDTNETHEESRPLAYKPAIVWATAPLAGLVVASALLGWGMRIREEGTQAPEGTLRIVAGVRPEKYMGNTICRTWTAVFTDSDGKSLNTLPGTVWGDTNTTPTLHTALRIEPQVKDAVDDDKASPMHSTLFIPLALDVEDARNASVEATYIDRFGRRYNAISPLNTP